MSFLVVEIWTTPTNSTWAEILWKGSHEHGPTNGRNFQADWLRPESKVLRRTKGNVKSRGLSGPGHR